MRRGRPGQIRDLEFQNQKCHGDGKNSICQPSTRPLESKTVCSSSRGDFVGEFTKVAILATLTAGNNPGFALDALGRVTWLCYIALLCATAGRRAGFNLRSA